MAHKNLFARLGLTRANSTNEAGGRAYAFTAEHALAQYAATGTFNRTFYATEVAQLEQVIECAHRVDDTFLAKTAVYTRTRGFMKDAPALLLAILATRNPRLLAQVFPRVVDNGKMLRNFVQIVRSGVTGRKSFGTAPKRLLRGWFAARTPEEIFRQSIGSAPSMADVIRMVRPSPKLASGEVDVMREALYGYLIGKDIETRKLPPAVAAFESFKNGGGALPEVPFEMLTAMPLTTNEWRTLAKRMSWQQLRMNLNTLARRGVFDDANTVLELARRLADPTAIRKAKVLPFQLLAAFRAASDLPAPIRLALQQAMEIALENVPALPGAVYVCLDVSGSMHSAITGYRKGATSQVRCLDAAALLAAALLRRNPWTEILPFSDDVVALPQRLNPLDSVVTTAEILAALPSGGTACSAPLRSLNERRAKGDLIVYLSDNMSWRDFGDGAQATAMAAEWRRFVRRNPHAKLALIDLQPYGSTPMYEGADVLNVGGFSDSVFRVLTAFTTGELDPEHWVGEIKRIAV